MKYLYILLFVITGTLVSCVEDDTDGVSQITNYPIITIDGASELFLTQGAAYTDAGAVSTEGGEEIETITTVSKGENFGLAFSTDAPDKYVVTYSAINKDGFAGNALKTVWVKPTTGDLTTDISGLYTSNVQRGGDFAVTAQYSDMKYILIKKTGSNTYAISDAAGGYYSMGRAYGPDYNTAGVIITIADLAANSFTFTPGPIAPFGITLNMSNMIVDAATKSITFTSTYGDAASGVFKVQLKQVQ